MKCPKCQTENPETARFCANCGTQLPSEEVSAPTETLETAKEELTTGSTFAGRYQIIEELGKGGMGKVYKAQDTEIKEKIALKLIKPEIAADKRTIERFQNELKFARKISHRNVCRMYDLNKEEGSYYITMEYVPGEDLKSTIRRIGQLPIAKTISIAKQVCEGLEEAHRLDVVHRDLKPQNIMIDNEGNARIMDFGIARSIKTKGLTGAGVMIGTPEYMSPEQVEGPDIDHRSDIYSLGIIIYEMVTGKVPFEGYTPLSISMKHKSETPKNPKEINAQIPEELSQLILKCLEKNREKRYQSAKEVHAGLTNIEKGIPSTEKVVPDKILKVEKITKVNWKKILPYAGAALLLILLIIGGVYLFTGRREAIDSIAVLPLENISGDPEQEYIADGMTESLITELSKIRAFKKVISRTSIMQYKGVHKPMPEIARELNINAVLEGSVLLVGDRMRITVQLIHAPTDKHIWADNYERDLRDILALQNEISQDVAREINLKLTSQEKERLEVSRQVNPEAHKAYLRGRFHWNKRTVEELKIAIENFNLAIEKDQDYALAHAGLADTYSVLPWYDFLSPKECFPKAKEEALRALEIDNTIAEAHASLAWINMSYDWDWKGAEREFKRAIELNPGYATAHHWYAFYLIWVKEDPDQSIAEIKLAQELDPLSLIINTNFGEMLFWARRYDQAIEQYRSTIEMEPNFSQARSELGDCFLAKKMFAEAITEFHEGLTLTPTHPVDLTRLGCAYALSGNKEAALEKIEELIELSKQKYISSYLLAMICTSLGEDDQAFKFLNKAYEERSYYLPEIKVQFLFDSIRSDPRFQALLKKMNFE